MKYKNRIIFIVLVILISFFIPRKILGVSRPNKLRVFVNDRKVYDGGLNLVGNEYNKNKISIPIDILAKNLGLKSEYISGDKRLIIRDGDKLIELIIGENLAYLDGKQIRFDHGSFLSKSRVYVPIQFILDNLEIEVENRTYGSYEYFYIKRPKKDNYYVGGVLGTEGSPRDGRLDLDETPPGPGWVEPNFRYRIRREASTPISIYLGNKDKLKGMTFKSRIVGNYSHFNTGTIRDPLNGEVRNVFRGEDGSKPDLIRVFSLYIPHSLEPRDRNGSPMTSQFVKGKEILVEIVANYKGMEKTYLIPVIL